MQPINISFVTSKDKGISENIDLLVSFHVGENQFIDWKHLRFSAHQSQIAKLVLPGTVVASAAQKAGRSRRKLCRVTADVSVLFVEIAPGQTSSLTADDLGFIQWSDPEPQPAPGSGVIVLINKTKYTQVLAMGIRESEELFSPIYGTMNLPPGMNANYAIKGLKMSVFGYRYPRDPNAPEHDPKDMLGEYDLSALPSPLAFRLFDDPSHGGQTVLVRESAPEGRDGKAILAAAEATAE
ncbi:hypothetical protein PsYK624_107560 [Phanerochaete sordida]|uniref:Uncharacterized protein n=1 Tax=Phanerochaete sordida TaxID=48140 RepID=A0A9P3LGI1_9APHY|nr:hypothetical protein PsYK624_107560 [Phanerochaete sordida]